MGETFLININCSKILACNDETQYTMFIDSSKMSIVYELVEWIRWIFSLENCFYITHNNSVIHELEDIQVLSKLKNFELKPCGQINCVHKQIYRTLLKNLNLFVSWNGTKVHKYFLCKLMQVDKKLSEESIKASPMISKAGTVQSFNLNTRFDNTKNVSPESNKFLLCENKLTKDSVSPVKKQTLIDKFDTKWGPSINEYSPEMNTGLDKKKISRESPSNTEKICLNGQNNAVNEDFPLEGKSILSCKTGTSPVKSKMKTGEETIKNCDKPYQKKYVKPFSLGEIVSKIREDIEKENTELKLKKDFPVPNSLISKEAHFDEEMTFGENPYATDLNISEGKRRQRTRRRKRKSKKENPDEELIPQLIVQNVPQSSLDMLKSNSNLKRNHIRFDTDEEDNQMETEYVEEEPKTENESKDEIINKEINDSTTFLKNEPKYLEMMDNNQSLSDSLQVNFVINNADNKMDCSSSAAANQFINEERLIDIDSKGCESSNAREFFESKTWNPSLNTLLSLKGKCKNSVVIERFY